MYKWLNELKEFSDILHEMTSLRQWVGAAAEILIKAAKDHKPILVCGNGGSAADSMHFAAELMGSFENKNRRPIECYALVSDPTFLTAWANDVHFAGVFARQIKTHAYRGGALMAISTSGKSQNVLLAAMEAREYTMPVIALTGANGFGNDCADVEIRIPSTSTPLIQQGHIIVYHYLAKRIEEAVCG